MTASTRSSNHLVMSALQVHFQGLPTNEPKEDEEKTVVATQPSPDTTIIHTHVHLIGSGAQAHVYIGTHKNTVVAIKQPKTEANKSLSPFQYASFMNECALLAKMQQAKLSHVVSYIDNTIDPETNTYSLTIEYLPRGTLLDWTDSYYRKSKHAPWPTCYKLMIDFAAALVETHNANILHRDIKPQNILLTEDDHVKLCDFALSAELEQGQTQKIEKHFFGSPRFIAPESIYNGEYSRATDIFSAGGVLFTLAEHVMPFFYLEKRAGAFNKILKMIKSGQRDTHFTRNTPPALVKLINQCWMHDPKQRPTANALHEKLSELAKTDVPEVPFVKWTPSK